MQNKKIWLGLSLLCSILINTVAFAQSLQSIEDSVDAIKQKMAQQSLTDSELSNINAQLQQIQSSLDSAASAENQLVRYEELASNIDKKLSSLQLQQEAAAPFALKTIENQSIEQLDNTLLVLQAKQNSLLVQYEELQQQKTSLSRRPSDINNELNSKRKEIETTLAAIANSHRQNDDINKQSNHVALQAMLLSLRTKMIMLEREVATVPARQSLAEAQLSSLEKQLRAGEVRIQQLQQQLEQRRSGGAIEAIKTAQHDLEATIDSPFLIKVATDNLGLATQLQAIVQNGPDIDENSLRLRQQQQNLRQSSQIISQILATGQITDDLGILLHRLRSGLPQEGPLTNRLDNINEQIVKHQLNLILWQDKLRNLEDEKFTNSTIYTTQTNAPKAQPALSKQQTQQLDTLNTTQQLLLQQLIAAANSQLEKLLDEKLMLIDVKASTNEFKSLLDRRLIWLPSYTQLGDNILPYLLVGLQWYTDGSAWLQLARDLWAGIHKNGLATLGVLLIFVLLLSLRTTLKRSLRRLSVHIGNVGKDTHWATPLALFETIILALPLPLAIATLAGLISVGASGNEFSKAMATALATVSSLSLTLLFFRSMCRRNGIFVAHFAWSDSARATLGTLLTRFAWYQGLATFLFASAIASNQIELRYGIAIVAFIAMSLGIATFSFHFFKPRTGVAVNIVGQSPKTLLTQLALPFMVIAPLLIGLLPLIGFFDTAVELQSKLFQSGVVLIFVAIFYGIVMRILMVAYRRYLLRKVKLRRAKQEIQRKKQELKEASGEAIPEVEQDTLPDNQQAAKKMRKNAMGLSSALFLVGLWFIWRPLLPALGIVNEIVLWQKNVTVDGIAMSENVSLWNIIVAVLFLIGGVIAAKNSRGMLEISFFDKVTLDPGARYAAVTILGYVIMGTSLVLGLSQLGIDWSKLQWIVAALGVGLGFGLQEIVANFVSGLIILFERPVRVGDTVTIGELSGTVSNIKIRATTITDFDNREVLLPNKSIITENVTNWTLHDPVTRLLLKIGIAYGSDTRLAREVLAKVLEEHPDVLKTPAPSVFFMNHGESSLDFELRIFVENPAKRLPVIHEINTLINEALSQNGFEIPFPQRDIHIIGANQSAIP